MIVREELTINNKQFIKTYSDKGMYIERDGVQYSEAIDPIEFAEDRIYIETDVDVVSDDVGKWVEVDMPLEEIEII